MSENTLLIPIKQRLLGVQGPWKVGVEAGDHRFVYSEADSTAVAFMHTDDTDPNRSENAAEFIAHAPEDIDFLVNEVERLERALANTRDHLTEVSNTAAFLQHQVEMAGL